MKAGDEVAGRYRLEEPLGHGAMSEVWRAHDGTLDRTVALKMLTPVADLERFRREAQALASLAHENITRVFDYGEDVAGPYMALEWLPGGTLEERLSGAPLPPGETKRIATGIAAGLAHLHARGLVHRDLKPANVLFDDDDRPKLADFGLARRAAGAGTLTEAGTVLGTAAYISPEQAGGEPAGPASDVYSFGVMLFRMLTGALPFVADDALALLDMHRRRPPPAVEDLRPDAPPVLAALAMASLAKDPTERPADGAALLSALGVAPMAAEAVADTEATRVMPAAVAPSAGSRAARRTAAIGAMILLLALAGGALAWIITRPDSNAPAGIVSSDSSVRTGTGHTGTTSASTGTGTTASTSASTSKTTTTHTTTAHTTTRGTTTSPTTTTPPTTTAPPTTATTASTSTASPTTTAIATT